PAQFWPGSQWAATPLMSSRKDRAGAPAARFSTLIGLRASMGAQFLGGGQAKNLGRTRNMLKAGYFPCTQDPPRGENIGKVLREAIVEAQVAEQSGFDSCLFSEHHQQEDAYIPNVILMAGMVGVNTTKIRVGTCVTLIPLWHPVHAAEDAAIVDQITGGRMILSVGVGYQERDFSAFGLSISERAGRSEEGVEVVKKCWTEERFSYRGKFYQLDNVMITPKPFQKPRPPIWMAAWTNVGLKRAARIADAWITSPLEHVQVIKQFANLYREE